MNYLLSTVTKSGEYQELCASLFSTGGTAAVTGAAQTQKTVLSYAIAEQRPLLYIAADESEANRITSAFNSFFDGGVYYFPQNDYCFADITGVSHEWENQRVAALAAVAAGNFRAVVATPDSLCRRTLPKERLLRCSFILKTGDEIPVEALIGRLLEGGYSHSGMVEGPGQFARRGGIVDFYPPYSQTPLRVDFFGDTIDIISGFDPITQRRTARQESCEVVPAREHSFRKEDLERLAQDVEALALSFEKKKKESSRAAFSQLKADAELFRAGVAPAAPDRFLNLLYSGKDTLFSYLPEETVIAVSESAAAAERLRSFSALLSEDIKAALESGRLTGEMSKELALSPAEFWQAASKFPLAFFNALPRGKFPVAPSSLCEIRSREVSAAGGNLDLLIKDIKRFSGEGFEVAVFCGSSRRAENLTAILRDNGIAAVAGGAGAETQTGMVQVFQIPLVSGIEYPDIKRVILTDGTARGAKTRRRIKHKAAGERLKTYNDLAVGDFVVHAAYGIGKYLGIDKLSVEGVTKDYVKIKYAGTDMLYVPAGQLDLLSKFVSGGEGARVKLNKMGGTEWAKTKLRVKKSVAEMADRLIELYAARSSVSGYAFSADTDWQNDFEQRFEFEETEDQLRCVREIKRDMEESTPMDRLLCGDVGFGKTEVALRAIFKCVSDSRQCAFLVPTTILVWQHYQTILKRFSGFPIKADILSRFRSPKQQREIIRRLQSGELDIVIGTHRLLQKDIKFKELGLVVIDEEQRFGVTHKEKLKEMTKEVDCLTLTATPIPRTLNMALSGIRDMSLIEEAPHNRIPVQTYVMEQDTGVIVEAIRRELRRGGQVFYLHNRVDSIVQTAARLQRALPDAAIAVGHGKMSEEELSAVWESVVKGDTDILVCTTIIETGVDVPNANTLIIEDADRLGLSQLYQIRGRVGRSERRAYVYFTYKRGKLLSEEAVKRLAAIREFTEFNSGFKIAMRDLEIRGAGNILGEQQHGHMEAVGYDMYVKLLEEAVAERRGLPPPTQTECAVDLFVSAHIPDTYISQPEQRIDIYKKIAAISHDEDLMDLFDELLDRYGDIPKPVETLCAIALLRGKAGRLGVSYITHKNGRLTVDAARFSVERVSQIVSKGGKGIMYSPSDPPCLVCRLAKGEDVLSRIKLILSAAELADKNP